jgi:hypothetical protein
MQPFMNVVWEDPIALAEAALPRDFLCNLCK